MNNLARNFTHDYAPPSLSIAGRTGDCHCAGSLVGWSTRLITGRSQVQVLPRAPFYRSTRLAKKMKGQPLELTKGMAWSSYRAATQASWPSNLLTHSDGLTTRWKLDVSPIPKGTSVFPLKPSRPSGQNRWSWCRTPILTQVLLRRC